MPTSMDTKELARLDPIIRQRSFFSAKVECKELLDGIRSFVQECIEEGTTEGEFIHRVNQWLRENAEFLGEDYPNSKVRFEEWGEEEARRYEHSVRHIDSLARLRLIFRTQAEMCAGFSDFLRDMEPQALADYPGWKFVRTPGAKTFRKDHVEHQGEVRLKTDFDYWLARNDPSFGGFNNPYPPFGFNSWMWTSPVSYAKCVRLGLLEDGEEVTLSDEQRKQWGLDGRHAAEVIRKMLDRLCKYPQDEPELDEPKLEEDTHEGEIKRDDWQQEGELWNMPESAMKNYRPSKTRDEAIQRVQRLVQNPDDVAFHTDTSKEVIDEFCAVVEQMIIRHNIHPHTLGSDVRSNGTRAVSYYNFRNKEAGIRLNQDQGTHGIYSHTEANNYKDSGFKRWSISNSVGGGSLQVTTTHEYGHLVHFYAMNGDCNHPQTLDKAGQRARNVVINAYQQARMENKDGTRDIYAISQYADTKNEEYFAECFAARSRGEKLPDYANKMIDEVLAIAQNRQKETQK